MTCDRPPEGWFCTRLPDHDGPCAAVPARATPLTVQFTIEEGDVWIDPDDVAWYVQSTEIDSIHLERTVTTTVGDPHEFVRKWRKMGA